MKATTSSDTRDDSELRFAIGELDLVAAPFWKALQRAVKQRAATISMSYDDAVIFVNAITAARELAARAIASHSAGS